jgi:hypothetical protein
LESLRFVACSRIACGEDFFLCLPCDRAHRYCAAARAGEAVVPTYVPLGLRYQRIFDGRRAHGARLLRYRERLGANVSHHRRGVVRPFPMVPNSSVTGATAVSGAREVSAHVAAHACPGRGASAVPDVARQPPGPQYAASSLKLSPQPPRNVGPFFGIRLGG